MHRYQPQGRLRYDRFPDGGPSLPQQSLQRLQRCAARIVSGHLTLPLLHMNAQFFRRRSLQLLRIQVW
jgi:hypothetical protein